MPTRVGLNAEYDEPYPVLWCRAIAWLDVGLEPDGVELGPRNCPSVRFRTSGNVLGAAGSGWGGPAGGRDALGSGNI